MTIKRLHHFSEKRHNIVFKAQKKIRNSIMNGHTQNKYISLRAIKASSRNFKSRCYTGTSSHL